MKAEDRKIVDRALAILAAELKREPFTITSTDTAADYCRLSIGALEHEVFAMLHLDNQHRLITLEVLFRGTIDGAAVYPREVVKSVLGNNSSAVIFTHNHPSGIAEPSAADIAITRRLQVALNTIDVRVLDHLVVSGEDAVSFAARGLI